MGEKGRIIHLLSKSGETFGWSSLVGRETYTALAECLASSEVIKVEKENLNRVFENDAASELVFFTRRPGIIGERLLGTYSVLLSKVMREKVLLPMDRRSGGSKGERKTKEEAHFLLR